MKPRFFLMTLVLLVTHSGGASALYADQLELKDGTRLEGIIQKVEKGQVTAQIGSELKVFGILEVTSMEFDTPRVPPTTSRLPWQHFLTSMEAQEMVGHIQSVEKAAAEIRELVDQTKREWGDRKAIASSDLPKWETAKERFRAPLSRYQEVLNDFYFHVLGKVDEYNALTKQANEIYVGVKGPFSIGSSLIPKEMEKLPLKKYVPGKWYDTIFYDGYNLGYNDGYEKYRTHVPSDTLTQAA